MLEKTVIIIFLVLNVFYISGGEPDSFSISVTPGGIVPVGENASYFKTGAGAEIAVDYSLDFLPFIFLRAEAGFEIVPFVSQDALSLFSFSAGAGVKYTPIERFTLSVFGTGGYY